MEKKTFKAQITGKTIQREKYNFPLNLRMNAKRSRSRKEFTALHLTSISCIFGSLIKDFTGYTVCPGSSDPFYIANLL